MSLAHLLQSLGLTVLHMLWIGTVIGGLAFAHECLKVGHSINLSFPLSKDNESYIRTKKSFLRIRSHTHFSHVRFIAIKSKFIIFGVHHYSFGIVEIVIFRFLGFFDFPSISRI